LGGGSSINGQLANRGAPTDYDEWGGNVPDTGIAGSNPVTPPKGFRRTGMADYLALQAVEPYGILKPFLTDATGLPLNSKQSVHQETVGPSERQVLAGALSRSVPESA
jgi:hypothetical protein